MVSLPMVASSLALDEVRVLISKPLFVAASSHLDGAASAAFGERLLRCACCDLGNDDSVRRGRASGGAGGARTTLTPRSGIRGF